MQQLRPGWPPARWNLGVIRVCDEAFLACVGPFASDAPELVASLLRLAYVLLMVAPARPLITASEPSAASEAPPTGATPADPPWRARRAHNGLATPLRGLASLTETRTLRQYAPGSSCSLRTFLFPAYRGSKTKIFFLVPILLSRIQKFDHRSEQL